MTVRARLTIPGRRNVRLERRGQQQPASEMAARPRGRGAGRPRPRLHVLQEQEQQQGRQAGARQVQERRGGQGERCARRQADLHRRRLSIQSAFFRGRAGDSITKGAKV